MTRPVLWSFRRCPYAMRARLAIASAGLAVELREIVLHDKPDAFLATSPSATVPCLDTGSKVIDESLDIMKWALQQNDPEEWLLATDEGIVSECDGPFKSALDRYKYPTRYNGCDPVQARDIASEFLMELDSQLHGKTWLGGNQPAFVDMATLPFVRQFCHVDLTWFETQPWPDLILWLASFESSARFVDIMKKYPKWEQGQPGHPFP